MSFSGMNKSLACQMIVLVLYLQKLLSQTSKTWILHPVHPDLPIYYHQPEKIYNHHNQCSRECYDFNLSGSRESEKISEYLQSHLFSYNGLLHFEIRIIIICILIVNSKIALKT